MPTLDCVRPNGFVTHGIERGRQSLGGLLALAGDARSLPGRACPCLGCECRLLCGPWGYSGALSAAHQDDSAAVQDTEHDAALDLQRVTHATPPGCQGRGGRGVGTRRCAVALLHQRAAPHACSVERAGHPRQHLPEGCHLLEGPVSLHGWLCAVRGERRAPGGV